MEKSNELERQSSIFRARSKQISEAVGRSPLSEISDPRRLESIPTSDCLLSPRSNYKYDENNKQKFEVMNVKIVIYALNGLMCEHRPAKKSKFGKKETTSRLKSDTKLSSSDIAMRPNNMQKLDLTTAVVSCQRNGISDQVCSETYLASMPLGDPIATSLNRVRYAALWSSKQSALHKEDGAIERSAFQIIRCMKQAAFTPGIGAGSNYCHETLEIGINVSRGQERIHLGTALIVIDGEEEGEVIMNVPATPILLNSKKVKKRKNKYGYFSNDPSRRFFLDKTSVLRIGVQVIPEDAMRFAREKEEKRIQKESELNELLGDGDFMAGLLLKMGDDDIQREGKSMSNCPVNPAKMTTGIMPDCKAQSNSILPNLLCGSIPISWVPNFLKGPDTEPDVPKEIRTDNNIDQFTIHSLMSSVSESTNGSDRIFEEVAGEL